ncbi:MAG: maleylpyruvate isomerase family mycothiol-dependent enzyme [Acidimicrobiia bacterium]
MTGDLWMTAPGDSAYRAARKRVEALVRSLSADQLATRVPACPDWTVKDVVSHLVGNTSDLLTGNLAEAGSDAWTAAQVASRRASTLEDVLGEWEANAAHFERLLEEFPPDRRARLLGDIASHEADLRAALGLSPGGGGEAARLGFERYLSTLADRIDQIGLPALRLLLDGETERVAGSAMPPAATVSADTHTLLRVLTGRRSPGRIRALHWEGDPEPYVSVLPNYPGTQSDLVD